MKHRGEDFVTLLQWNARVDVLERVQDVDITDEAGARHVSDQRIELAETGEEFRRIVFGTSMVRRFSTSPRCLGQSTIPSR